LYYIRMFSSTIIASPEEEKQLFYVSSNIPYDDRPNLAADVSDLDIGLMRQHLKEIGSSLYELSLKEDALKIARDMQLISGPIENIKPLNVGILMFSEQPERYFRYARIEVVDIPDPTGTNMVEKVFIGPIQRQLKDALTYIKNYILKEVIIKDAHKAESLKIYNYPYAAVEELLSNAVYHRSYQVNERVATGRADAVLTYLANSGVAPQRLAAQGIPMADYVASNDTPAGRAQNRRVEIYITADKTMIEQAEAGTLK